MRMKISSIFLLAALVAMIISPVTVCISRSRVDNEQYFTAVDVCSGSNHFVPTPADIPALHECPCALLPLDATDCLEANDPSFTSSLFSVPIERPPKE
jgi:hypothetical protein